MSEDAVIRLCGPCRHFEQGLFDPHACKLGLPLLDGAERVACVSFDPFPRGEGSLFEQSDCCAHSAEEGHTHEDSALRLAEPAQDEPSADQDERARQAQPDAGG